jgi:hypothetical protein
MDPGENCHRWLILPEVIVPTSKSIPSNGRWVSLTVSILERVFPCPRGFNVRLWDSEELAEDSSAPFVLVLNHPGALRRMFSPPIELSLGEAFINKDFDIEGDIISAFTCMESIAGKLSSPAEAVGLLRDLVALPRGNANQLAGRGPMKLAAPSILANATVPLSSITTMWGMNSMPSGSTGICSTRAPISKPEAKIWTSHRNKKWNTSVAS